MRCVYTLLGDRLLRVGGPEHPRAIQRTQLEVDRIKTFVSNNKGACFIHIRSEQVNFGKSSFALPGPELGPWVGGEGAGIPHMQHGDRRGLHQEQLFALTEGDRIIVVDGKGYVVIVYVENNEPRIRPAEIADLRAHFTDRGRSATQEKERGWLEKVHRKLDDA